MSRAVTAIVLAAGESTRMGVQKALLEWKGVPLIAYQLQQLAAVDVVEEIIVVAGYEPERIRDIASSHPRTAVVHNAAYRNGKVSSIVTGLHAIRGNAGEIMVLGVDQPRSARVLQAILVGHARSGAPITVPVHGGHRGHPTVFSRVLLPELLAITEETKGLREILQTHAAEVHEVACDESVLVDLNEPADMRAASRDL